MHTHTHTHADYCCHRCSSERSGHQGSEPCHQLRSALCELSKHAQRVFCCCKFNPSAPFHSYPLPRFKVFFSCVYDDAYMYLQWCLLAMCAEWCGRLGASCRAYWKSRHEGLCTYVWYVIPTCSSLTFSCYLWKCARTHTHAYFHNVCMHTQTQTKITNTHSAHIGLPCSCVRVCMWQVTRLGSPSDAILCSRVSAVCVCIM